MVSKTVNIVLRAFEFIWALLIMSLVGNMIDQASNGNPASVNFAIVVSVFAMLSLFYLIPTSFNDSWAVHPIIPLVLDGVNTVLFFIAGVVLAAALDAHSCSNRHYLDTNHVTNGTREGNREKRCREGQASTAFLWFGFATFAASLFFSAVQGRSGPVGRRGGMRTGPTMSQV